MVSPIPPAPPALQLSARLAAIAALDGSARDAATEAFYRAIGAGSYAAIDVNDRYGKE